MKQKYTSYNFHRLFILFFLAFIPYISIFSQAKKLKVHEDYINKYKDIAIYNMNRYGIPASITLAQGIAESGAGRSALTLRSNNHFGIKCHKDWTGGKVYHNDDEENECFRKYRKAEDSFEDHSMFLSGRERYKSLFSLKTTDYKGWAKGLQKAGYATDKSYANKLIKMVEDYELHQYDKAKVSLNNNKHKKEENTEYYSGTGSKSNTPPASYSPTVRHIPYRTYNLVYVIAVQGDTYESIAAEFKFDTDDLYKYNDIPSGYPLKTGDLVYFQKKKSKADKPYYEHVVRAGESMHTISQHYGVRVKNLYKMNKRSAEYVPMQGDVLKLR